MVIFRNLIRDPISRSGTFKGPWMGILLQGAKGPLFEGAKLAKSAAMGDSSRFSDISVKIGQNRDFQSKSVKIGIFLSFPDKIGTYTACSRPTVAT